MKPAAVTVPAIAALLLPLAPLAAEPMFLSRQYARCTSCHYSPTGGGLLTPYGRSLSRQELSTTGRSPAGAEAQAKGRGEEAFLFGALGDRLAPLDLGIDTRPSHLRLDVAGQTSSNDFLMNADLWAAWRSHGWTAYGEIGRQPPIGTAGAKLLSYEHWGGYQSDTGLGIRVGRFFPAYGIRFADHTAYSRAGLGFNMYDQVYAVEVSVNREHALLQLTAGPGLADAVIHDRPDRAFTATGRLQMDVGPRTALVVSGLYRAASTLEARNAGGGLAFGFSPLPHVTMWTEADAQVRQGTGGAPAYTLVNETSLEVHRGVWLKVSPQLRTDYGDVSGGVWRLVLEANLLPRTHWNVDLSYYRDSSRTIDLVTTTVLAQLHLYL